MANTKKPKTQTEEVVEQEVVQEPVKTAPKKTNKPKHDPSELILCRSVRFGGLRLIGPKTHMPYEWVNEGDVREVEYQDLVSWHSFTRVALLAVASSPVLTQFAPRFA